MVEELHKGDEVSLKEVKKIPWRDIILFGVILCAFFSGFLIGEKITFHNQADFFIDYIDGSCSCDPEIYLEKSQIKYQNQLPGLNFSIND